MKKVLIWLETNLDYLYEHRLPQFDIYLKDKASKSRASELWYEKTIANERKMKEEYFEFLFTYMQMHVKERRNRMQEKFVQKVKTRCHPSQDYEYRNKFVENKIEDDISFFSHFKVGSDQFI
mmetsp:Transcript_19875/g.30608  ORF Transcript_19875/g.30608 Transcript_19875/m.30608 type:complete len:122 (+) Transcript_19875:576-941(+)